MAAKDEEKTSKKQCYNKDKSRDEPIKLGDCTGRLFQTPKKEFVFIVTFDAETAKPLKDLDDAVKLDHEYKPLVRKHEYGANFGVCLVVARHSRIRGDGSPWLQDFVGKQCRFTNLYVTTHMQTVSSKHSKSVTYGRCHIFECDIEEIERREVPCEYITLDD